MMAGALQYGNAMNRIIGVLVLALAIVGCKKGEDIVDSFTHFTFETDYVVKVPVTPISGVTLDFVTPDIATHSEDTFLANHTRADLVEQIKLQQLDLVVKTPVGGTLGFLKSVTIYARAEGLPEVKVASKDIVPDNVGGTLSLDVTGVDLTEYFKKSVYQLRISVTSDQAVTEDYGVNAHGVFFVDAKVLGQ
jgi:hypothetical protein